MTYTREARRGAERSGANTVQRLQAPHILLRGDSLQQPSGSVTTIIPIFEMGKLRHRELNQMAEDTRPTVAEQESNPASLNHTGPPPPPGSPGSRWEGTHWNQLMGSERVSPARLVILRQVAPSPLSLSLRTYKARTAVPTSKRCHANRMTEHCAVS